MRKLFAIPDRLVLPASFPGRLFILVLSLMMVGVTLIPSREPSVWLTRDLVLQWAALLLLGLSVTPRWGAGEKDVIRLDAFDLLALAGMAWFSLAAWNSERSFEAFVSLRGFWTLGLLWFALRAAWRRWPTLFPWFMAVFLGTALMASFWVAIQTLRNHAIPIEGPFANVNFAAAFIGMAFLATLVRVFQGGGGGVWALAGVFFTAWALARSRGSLVALVAALAAYVLLHARVFEEKLHAWDRRKWMLAGAVVLVMGALSAPMVNRLMTAGERDPRAYWRVLIWESSWSMASDHPLLGVGPGVYGTFYPYYRPARVWFNENPFAHNEYLQAAAEAGCPGFLWALGTVGLGLVGLAALSRRKGGAAAPSQDGQVVDAALLALALLAVHATMDFVLHEWCVALALLALASYALRQEMDLGVVVSVRLSRLARMLLLALCACGLLWVMGVGSIRDERAQRCHLRAIQAGRLGDADQAEALERRALGFAPTYASAWNSLAYLAGYRADAAETPARRDALLLRADEYYQKALACAPHDMTIRENQVEFFMAHRAWGKALDLQKNLLQEAPNHLPSYDRLGRIDLGLGRPGEAAAICAVALQKKETYIPAALVRVEALARLGRRDEALRTARKVLETEPDETEPAEMTALRGQLLSLARGIAAAPRGR